MKIFKTLSKRGLALFLALTMCIGLLPATALAAELTSDPTAYLQNDGSTVQAPDTGDPDASVTPAPAAVTFQFLDGNNNPYGAPQTLAVGETLQMLAPPHDLDVHNVFEGWQINGNLVENGSFLVTEELAGQTVSVTPQFGTYWFVTFTDESGRVYDTVRVRQGDNGVSSTTADRNYLPDATHSLAGWSLTQGGKAVDLATLPVNDDIDLYPVLVAGQWLSFNSQGGTYVPQGKVENGLVQAPAVEPYKKGFTFGGWYETPDCTGSQVRFPYMVNEATTLYAKWTGAEVKYTVVYWVENADWDNQLPGAPRDPEQWSYRKSETEQGASGTTTNVSVARSLDSWNELKSVDNQVISGDGSTVVNVYYTRKTNTITFWYRTATCGKSGWSHSHSYTQSKKYSRTNYYYGGCYPNTNITVKYGATIPKSAWPKNDSQGDNWMLSSQQWLAYTSSIEKDWDLYEPSRESGTSTAYYYVEIIPGETNYSTEGNPKTGYKLHHKDTPKGTGMSVADQDKYPIPGYTFKNVETDWFSSYDGAKFYYTRNSYKIDFKDGSDTARASVTLKYEQSIGGAAQYKPTNPTKSDGSTFDGWYLDAAFTKPAAETLNGKMPAGNLVVYGKWSLGNKQVTIHASTQANAGSDQFEVEVGKLVDQNKLNEFLKSQDKDLSDLLGWYTKNEKGEFVAYNLNDPVESALELYALWRSDTYPVTYLDKDGTELELSGGTYSPNPDGNAANAQVGYYNGNQWLSFDHWEDNSGNSYYPGNTVPVSTGGTTLKAVGKLLSVTVRAKSETITYDGQPHTVTGFIGQNEGEDSILATTLFGQEIRVHDLTATGSGKDAGTYQVTVNGTEKVTVTVGSHELDVTDQVAVNKLPGELKITKRNVTLVSVTLSKEYDGTALTNGDTALATENGWAEGEGATYTFTGTQTLVGNSANAFTYTLNTNTNVNNYIISKSEGTLSVTNRDAKYEVSVTGNTTTGIYNGTPYTVSGLVGEMEQGVPVTAANGKTYYVTGLTCEATGTNVADSKSVPVEGTAVVKDEAGNIVTEQFNVTPQPGTLTITKRSVTLKSADLDKVYDGTALTNGAETVAVDGDGFVTGQGATYNFTGSQTVVGSSPNAFTYELTGGADEANYNIIKTEGTLTVKDRPEGQKFQVTVKANSLSDQYDGAEKTVSGFEDETERGIPVTANDLTFYVSGLTSRASGTNVSDSVSAIPVSGTAVVKDADGNDVTSQFNVTVEKGHLTINKRIIVMTSATDEQVYNGKALKNDEVTLTGSFVDGEGATYDVTGTQTLPGESKNFFTYALNANTDANNYDISQNYGTLKVTNRTDEGPDKKFEITVKANSDTVTYDGDPHGVSGFEHLEHEIGGVKFYVSGLTAEAAGTDAGTYTAEVTGDAVVKDADGNDVTSQFIVKTEDGTLTINKRNVTLTSATDSKVFDGTALTNDTVTVSGEGFAKNEGASYNVTGSQTVVGSSNNTFTYTLNADTKADNYTITEKTGTLTVTDRDAKYEITVEANSKTELYSGAEQTVSGLVTDTFEVEGVTYKVTGLSASAKGTDAGTYEALVEGDAKVMLGSEDVTSQFTVKRTPGKLTINKRSVVMTSGSAEREFNGQALVEHTVDVGGDGFVTGQGATYSYTGTQTYVGSSKNFFDYRLNEGTNADNYDIQTNNGTLTVTNRVESDKYKIMVEANSDTVKYDGQPHTVNTLKGTTFTVDGVEYTVSGLSADVTKTDAGEYTVNVTGTPTVKLGDTDVSAQFAVSTKAGKLTIEKRSVVMTSGSAEQVYDGKALTKHEVTVAGDGFVEGEGAEYTYTGSQTLVGESDNFFTYALTEGTKAGNYEIAAPVYGTLKVTGNLFTVAKTPQEPGPFNVGDSIVWDIVVTNQSSEEITVSIRDDMPGVTSVQGPATIVAGDSLSLTHTYFVQRADAGKTLVNTVTVTDQNNQANSASAQSVSTVVRNMVVYQDGLDGEIFEEELHHVSIGDSTPYFTGGTPVRDGYVFTGWSPAVAETVTGNATYTATWEEDTKSDPTVEPDPTKPGDGIPDKYQVTVNYVAVNGSVSFDSTVVTKYDADGNYAEDGTAKLADSHIPATVPANGFIDGVWDVTPEVDREVTDGETFTITYRRLDEFTVTYVVNGQRPDGFTNPGAVSVQEGGTHTVIAPLATRTGTYNGVPGRFTFSGWSRTGAITVTGNVTITGAWTFTPSAPNQYTVTYSVTGAVPTGYTAPQSTTVNAGTSITVAANPAARTGYYNGVYGTFTFGGWSQTGTVVVNGSLNITGTWYFTQYNPPYYPDPDPDPDPDPAPTPTPPVTIPDDPTPMAPGPDDTVTITDENVPLAAPGLNSVDHFDYIKGYGDGTVKPERNITRAEVATIFFRLMTSEYRTESWATENDFTDVKAGDWFNNAISTSAKAGILKGYEDGSFQPNKDITRAEFATIAARFASEVVPSGGMFEDIEGHWAQENIERASAAGWIRGSEGKFRPNDMITRAEVITAINRMLDRIPDAEHMHDDMKTFVDNTPDKWYYAAVQEATNSHDYERGPNGASEIWTEILPEQDWAALEKEWATAASAPVTDVAPSKDEDETDGAEDEGETKTEPETTGDGDGETEPDTTGGGEN